MVKRRNWFVLLLILSGAVLFGVVALTVVRSTRTVNAVMPNQTIRAGERIAPDMLSVVAVPVNTPRGYITDRSSLVGQKLKITADAGQFLYMSDVMMSWDDIVYGVNVPDDYVITAITVPNDRAVGGLITSGDTIDILGVPKQSTGTDRESMRWAVGAIADHGYGAEGINVYWILANVKILETDSSLANKDDSALAAITDGDAGNQGAYYIVALSYADYQKLVLAQQYMTLWLNIAPAWNNENGPLLEVMTYAELKGLMDAQAQSVIEAIHQQGEADPTTGEPQDQVVYRISEEALKGIEESKKRWEERNLNVTNPQQDGSQQGAAQQAGPQQVEPQQAGSAPAESNGTATQVGEVLQDAADLYQGVNALWKGGR